MGKITRTGTKYVIDAVTISNCIGATDALTDLKDNLKNLDNSLKLEDKKAKRINTMKRRRLYNKLR